MLDLYRVPAGLLCHQSFSRHRFARTCCRWCRQRICFRRRRSRLASGKRVNSALDNPTNYFTASALDNRASDINNLLDSIGNGVQVLQAANTGISSLQTLVNNAKSVTNQALQTQVGYSQKSTVTSAAITGATASNILGDYVSVAKVGSSAVNNRLSSPVAITSATTLVGGANTDTILATGALTTSDTITVNGTTISFTAAATGTSDATHVRLDEFDRQLAGQDRRDYGRRRLTASPPAS